MTNAQINLCSPTFLSSTGKNGSVYQGEIMILDLGI